MDRTLNELRQYRAGDEDAFTRLYDRLSPAVYAWATLRIAPSLRGRIDPEDVVQDVWRTALKALPSFDPNRGSFRSWIFGVAANVLLNEFRALKVRGEIREDGGKRPTREARVPSVLEDPASSISERAARNEKARLVIETATELGDIERSMTLYCGLEGRTATEVAPLLGLGAEAAMKRWQRLRSRLGALLGEDGDLLA